MPRMDGTGPEGKGSGTGRGLGRCRRNAGNEDNVRPGKGSAIPRQSGGGRGQGRRQQGGFKK